MVNFLKKRWVLFTLLVILAIDLVVGGFLLMSDCYQFIIDKSGIGALAVSPDGQYLLVGGRWGDVWMHHIKSKKKRWSNSSLEGWVVRVAFSTDGSLAAVGTTALSVEPSRKR
jgi:WD40 repeat protein